MVKLGARELRTTLPTSEEIGAITRHPIYIVLDNVLDTYNVGSIFRLADAIAAEEVILCGETEKPPHTRIKKASINTTEWVKWEHKDTSLKALNELKEKISNIKIVSVEQDERSVPFYRATYELPLAVVVGNETYGVSKEVLDISDLIVELPVWGVNKSLNVIVSLGIVLYEMMEQVVGSSS